MSDELREILAAYAHDAWSGWMNYLFQHCTKNDAGRWEMDNEKALRWQRQMHTPFDRLPEDEKESDRHEADRMLAMMYDDEVRKGNP